MATTPKYKEGAYWARRETEELGSLISTLLQAGYNATNAFNRGLRFLGGLEPLLLEFLEITTSRQERGSGYKMIQSYGRVRVSEILQLAGLCLIIPHPGFVTAKTPSAHVRLYLKAYTSV